jgi:hypothetical protein
VIAIELRTHIFTEAWSQNDSEKVLDMILELLVQIDILYLRRKPKTPKLYESGVRYYHDGIRDEWFSVDEAIHEGLADCKGLSAWRVAELRESGEDRGAKCTKKFAIVEDPTIGGRLVLYHVLVQRSDGNIEDPSRKLGMNLPEPDGYIPVPGVPWVVVNGMENVIGAAMNGNTVALDQLTALGVRARQGNKVARYLVDVGKRIRAKGYTPAKTEFKRQPDFSWEWVYPDEGTEGQG